MTRKRNNSPTENERFEWQNFQSHSRGSTHQQRSAGISEFFASKYMLNVLHNLVSFSTLLLSFHFQLIYFALLLLLLYFGLFYSVYKCLTLTIALSALLTASLGLSYWTNLFRYFGSFLFPSRNHCHCDRCFENRFQKVCHFWHCPNIQNYFNPHVCEHEVSLDTTMNLPTK